MSRGAAAPLLALLLAACGYNAAYTAQRRAAEAERAGLAGDTRTARVAWQDALDAAAAAYRAEPSSSRGLRALVVIARSRLALGDNAAAAGAARHALRQGVIGHERAITHSILGTALLRSDSAHAALAHLDSALVTGRLQPHDDASARMHRGLSYLRLARYSEAYTDLDAASQHSAWRVDAARAIAEAAIGADDLPRFQAAFRSLADAGGLPVAAMLLEELAHAAARKWGPQHIAEVAGALRPLTLEDDVAFRIAVVHAHLASRAILDEVHATHRLADVDELLAPVSSDSGARRVLHAARGVLRLVQQAGPTNPLPLFAAAELARDELVARSLAAALFLEFARVAKDTSWSGKAILAAHELAASPETRALIDSQRNNIYVKAAHGLADPDELTLAEERLARGLAGLRDAALLDPRRESR
jgi:hypothetical protein